ncbi:hypothetical protein DVH05_024532 [Phytophthora capsici]|nr:hypothetical protein DVH05_024532 [Phytophthora capsici]
MDYASDCNGAMIRFTPQKEWPVRLVWTRSSIKEKYSTIILADQDAVEDDPKKSKSPVGSAAFMVMVAFQYFLYSVPDPKSPKETLDLLKGVSGFTTPGLVTALRGSSGADKTTLMDVVGGRETDGTGTDKILLNGYEANDLAIHRCTGYYKQIDLRSEGAHLSLKRISWILQWSTQRAWLLVYHLDMKKQMPSCALHLALRVTAYHRELETMKCPRLTRLHVRGIPMYSGSCWSFGGKGRVRRHWIKLLCMVISTW